ncbi:hypothetical protein M3Y95_00005100 [Aphelenchoides besseyi]|nr:hypothetical protein M3Y95_00005100 [Aphelenchoides besseyi]
MLQWLVRGSIRCALHQQSIRSISTSPFVAKGHSKWQNIKDTKGKIDLLRSKKISYFLKKAKQAVRDGGGFDMKLNRQLAAVQQEFRNNSLPLDTFTNYLVKLKDKPEQTVYYELVGPGGSFVIIETETDNSSRTKTVIQKYMNKVGGFRIGNDLRKRFDEKLFVVINAQNEGKEVDAQQLEEVAIEFDCEELKTIYEDDEKKYELQFQFGTLSNAEESFKSKGFNVETTEVRLIPQHAIPMSTRENEVVEKLYSLLDDVEEVKNIFDNRAED